MLTDRTPSILVVDDTEANIDILVELLGDTYEVMVAMDGESALEIAHEEQPDLVLLDVMMPEMDGWEVCRRLKADDTTRDIPIIFVTAKIEVADETMGLEIGAVDYITKPISPPVVLARIRTHLGLKFAQEKLAEQNRELVKAAELKEEVDRITRHDLKNPLTTILSVPQLLAFSDNIRDDQREMLGRVEQAGFTMLSMINFSLDLFKMEQGTYTLHPEDVDICKLIHRIGSEFEDLAHSRKVRLKLVAGDGGTVCTPFIIQGEELLCYSLFSNLIKNAMEASPPDNDITVTFKRHDVNAVEIHNVGAIPESIRERFFEKYATSGKERGTGLGTYSAKLSTDVLRGKIGFTTSEEEGTTLKVQLPA